MSEDNTDLTGTVSDERVAAIEQEPPAGEEGSELVRLLSQGHKDKSRSSPPEIVIGRLLGLVDDGRVPLVASPGQTLRPGVRARSIVDLYSRHVGCEVVLLFDHAKRQDPVVIGVLRNDEYVRSASDIGALELSVDGERLIVSAAAELVLRCGKSRLTLRSDGQIEVSGETIITRATGTNRIQGGSVQLN